VALFSLNEMNKQKIKSGKTVICENCGKEIYKTPQALVQKHHYCSRKCFSSHYRKGQFVICAICGKQFWMENWQLKISKKYYCSRECWRKRDMSEISKKISNTLSGRKIKGKFIKCSYCGKTIWKANCFIKKHNFCSNKCKCNFRKTDEETNKKIAKSNKGKKRTKEMREAQAKRLKGIPCPAHSKRMTKKWRDNNYVQKQMYARNVMPNKTELFLDKFLGNLLPSEYKFVGDGQFILAGKCPDFVNINGQKKIVELYGDYWHKNDNPQDRINLFKQFGYETLVIWEHELKELDSLTAKISNFNSEHK